MPKKIFLISIILPFLFVSFTQAADFNIAPATGQLGLKQEQSVNIKINTAGDSVNAAQAKIKFSPSILEIKSISKDGSIFNFWLQEPEFSNTDGTINFIGGTPNGVSGASLQVLKINFISKGIGASEFSFIDASVNLADGSGTNVLENANGANFTVSSAITVPKVEKPGEVAPPMPVATPVQITRTPVIATGLPSTPSVNIPLYPDPAKWYNLISQFTVSWDLPSDISDLNTAINNNPNFAVPEKSEGLFDNKTLAPLNEDGIYYFHIRFKNNKGWGPTGHYRIAVDTRPPLPFKIEVKSGLESDDPSPKLTFHTADSLSGIGYDEIYVNSEEPVIINDSEYSLPPRQPGKYTIRARVFDKAGNSVEDMVEVEILPIEMPVITAINKKIIIGTDDLLVIKGMAIIGADVMVTIEDKNGFLVLKNDTKTNSRGEWEFRLDRELRRGDYLVSLQAKDSRSAVSLPTEPIRIKFVEKPVMSLFGLDITLRGLIIILTVAGILAASWSYRKTLLHLARFQRESVIISRDLSNAFGIVKKDLDRISGITKKDVPPDQKEVEFDAVNKKIVDALDRIEKYMSGDIEKLE